MSKVGVYKVDVTPPLGIDIALNLILWGNGLKNFLKWSYFWVLLVGILIGYFGIPMLWRLLYHI